jgi:alkylated DNA nucleotide flippase Atl1
MTREQERTLELADLVQRDNGWTTYGAIGKVVYGAGGGAQTVGNTMRDYGSVESAHRVLRAGGRMSSHFSGAGGSPEEAISRLEREGIWDTTNNRARKDRFIDAHRLEQLEARHGPEPTDV